MPRYKNTKVEKTKLSSKYYDRRGNVLTYNTTIYKDVPEKNSDTYLLAQDGDRLDNLANQFYGNSHLWWFLARVNNLKTMNVPAGTSLRVPASVEDAFSI